MCVLSVICDWSNYVYGRGGGCMECVRRRGMRGYMCYIMCAGVVFDVYHGMLLLFYR